VAEAVAVAERRRFELGETDLFVVNLREQAAAEADAARVDAEADLQIAEALFRAAMGDLLAAGSR
jgi:outer membrane protein TolC